MVQLPHRIGKYTLHRRLGGGGMGQVYLATLEGAGGFERDVAIKLVRSELAASDQMIEMFLREGRALAALNHRNVIHVFELDAEGDQLYLAMEYLSGLDLGQIRTKGPLAWPAAVYIAAEVARGLAAAHALRRPDAPHGIVHGDVSPSNVMVCKDGAVKVLDFGIARPVGFAPSGVNGKLPYLPPESLVGSSPDERTDLYGLGVVLYELLTGERLFRAASDAKIRERVMHEKVAPPSATVQDLPPPLDALVMTMINRDRAARPSSALEVAEALDRIVDGRFTAADLAAMIERMTQPWGPAPTTMTPLGRTQAAHSGPQTPSVESPTRSRGIVIGIAAVVALGGGAVVWQAWDTHSSPRVEPKPVTMETPPPVVEPPTPTIEPAKPGEPAVEAPKHRAPSKRVVHKPPIAEKIVTKPSDTKPAKPEQPKPDGSASIAPGYLANPFEKK